jgi:hypothetical protein
MVALLAAIGGIEMENKNFLIGVLLVAIGVLFLLSNFGILTAEIWPLLIKFWPVVLICAGLLTVDQSGKWGMYISLALVIAVLVGVVYYSFSGLGSTFPGRRMW